MDIAEKNGRSRYSEVKTVCLGLGPYRNLTTLTAGMLFLHPAIQVLNHGAPRILPDESINFLGSYSNERFEKFLKFAIELSAGGERGLPGGSITLSHAFDRSELRQIYENRYGCSAVKETVGSFFWKEPLRVGNFLRMNKVDFSSLFSDNEKIRFLMPVRNPIDCAFSNLRNPHKQLFAGLKTITVETLLEAILGEIAWFMSLKEKFPDRFFYFCENEVDRDTLSKLAGFLSVDADDRWISDCLDCYQLKGGYSRPEGMVDYYRKLVKRQLSAHPGAMARLMKYQ